MILEIQGCKMQVVVSEMGKWRGCCVQFFGGGKG